MRELAVAIVVAGLAVALAIGLHPVSNRYFFQRGSKQIVRYDTATGKIRVCNEGGDRDCFDWDMDSSRVPKN